MIVLDASIVMKWFVQENDSLLALKFREKLIHGVEEIVIPDILIYEIVNALRFKKGVPEQVISSILPTLFNIGFEIIMPTEKLMREAFHLSLVTDLSIYDSTYLALANEFNVPLITADKRIHQQAEPFTKIHLLHS